MRNSQMTDWPTRAEMNVMRLLQNHVQGMYGLEIVDTPGSGVKRGSVYVLLGRLEEKGFVKSQISKVESGHPGLPRPTYKLTAEGSRVLSAAGLIGLAIGA